MTVRRFASVAAFGVTVVVGLGLVATPVTARQAAEPTASLVSVRAVQPVRNRHRALVPQRLNVVTASTKLAFMVQVHNNTNAPQPGTPVTVRLTQGRGQQGPFVKRSTLDLGPNQTATIRFGVIYPVMFATESS